MTAACPACIAAPVDMDQAPVAQEAHQSMTLSVPGMKCAACIGTVERALNAIPGVEDARVNLTLKRVSLRGALDAENAVQALAAVGYDAYPFDLQSGKASDNRVSRDLILRLGVAGFAMMNVMLLSVAVWSGATDATRDLFHLISATIALPTTIFSAQPFFRNAWSAIRVARMNMDVPISLAILLAAGMSLYESLNGGAHAYFDAALSLTFFLLIGRVLEHHTRAAAKSAAEDLAALEEHRAQRKTANGYETVAQKDLRIGDEIFVAAGMRVPVDGVAQSDTVTDRAFLTGESDPVHSTKGAALRAGEINLGTPFHLTATAVGEDTSLRQMTRLVETAENARNSYTTLADRAARLYAPAVHILALLAFLGWYIGTGDLRLSLNIAIAVLIITCPCALGLAVPAVSTAAIGRLYGMGFLVKSGTALERLAETNQVVFDKTGTLTLPGITIDAGVLSQEDLSIAKALAQSSAHPLSKALAEALDDQEPALVTEITEVPGKGVSGLFKGQSVALGQGAWLGMASARLALKIGANTTAIPVSEVLRGGSEALAPALKDLNLRPHVLSGDTVEKTKELAQRLNMPDWQAGVTPEEKFQVIERLQAGENHVAMIGDGINDAAALTAAHSSVAPGSALDAARNAADVILLRPSLEDLPKLFRISRLAVHLSRQNFAIATLYNAIAIPIALAGFATPLLAALAMSLSSITVLLNALRIRIAK